MPCRSHFATVLTSSQSTQCAGSVTLIRLVISGGVMAGYSFKSPFSEGWWDSEKICQKFPKSGFNYSLFSTKNTKRHVFWKGACLFEKKRAPARNARNRDEERVFLKKRAPARQTPGVVAELKNKKEPLLGRHQVSSRNWFYQNPHFYRKSVFPSLISRKF